MAIGKYITDAINQTIANERMTIRDKFSKEIQQLRFDEANAYTDKDFMESVRQFELKQADKRIGRKQNWVDKQRRIGPEEKQKNLASNEIRKQTSQKEIENPDKITPLQQSLIDKRNAMTKYYNRWIRRRGSTPEQDTEKIAKQIRKLRKDKQQKSQQLQQEIDQIQENTTDPLDDYQRLFDEAAQKTGDNETTTAGVDDNAALTDLIQQCWEQNITDTEKLEENRKQQEMDERIQRMVKAADYIVKKII